MFLNVSTHFHTLGFFLIDSFVFVNHRILVMCLRNSPQEKYTSSITLGLWILKLKDRKKLFIQHTTVFNTYCFAQLQSIFYDGANPPLLACRCLQLATASPFLFQRPFLFLAPLRRIKPHICQCVCEDLMSTIPVSTLSLRASTTHKPHVLFFTWP